MQKNEEQLQPIIRRHVHLSDDWQYTRDSGEFTKIDTKSPQIKSPISPSDCIEHIIQLSVASKDDIWGLSNAGILYRFDQTTEGNDWVYFKVSNDLRFSAFTITPKYHLFAISDGRLYRLKDPHQASALEAAIRKTVREHNGTDIAIVGAEFVPVIQNDDQIVIQVSASTHKLVYALSANDHAICLEKQRFSKSYKWENFGPDVPLRKISVGGTHIFRNTEIWAIRKSDNAALRYNKTTKSWDEFNYALQDISVSLDNAVYGISLEDGYLVKWDGNFSFVRQDKELIDNKDKNTYWKRLKNVYALKEGKHVYSVDTENGHLLKMVV
jgi:hypothetical protein